MQPNIPPKFSVNDITEETQSKIDLSYNECKALTERALKCPYCNFYISDIFSDVIGHIRVKCPKCKANLILNTAYFRRKKNYSGHRYQIRKYKR
jgi:phage FluMu protein Com